MTGVEHPRGGQFVGIKAEQRARDAIEEELAEMRASLDAARHAWQLALAAEGDVWFAQEQVSARGVSASSRPECRRVLLEPTGRPFSPTPNR